VKLPLAYSAFIALFFIQQSGLTSIFIAEY
jgi:hypothetical protein